VWQRLDHQDRPDGSCRGSAGLSGCATCGLVNVSRVDDPRCPRCESILHERKPDSIARTWALVIAAAVLYLPANYYPVVTVVQLGAGAPSTILGGAEELLAARQYPLAALVFFASILVPMPKLIGLSIMLIATRTGRTGWLRDRTRLYHIVRFIGRWSMIDIFMESLAPISRNCIARTPLLPKSSMPSSTTGRRMPGSRASVFGEAEDFQAALSVDGVGAVLFTGRGRFRARMTQVALDHLRLAAVEETQSRVAFIAVPRGMVLVSFPTDGGPSPIWGGLEIRASEMISLGPGQRVHARIIGPCHWYALQVAERQLADYGGALNGAPFIVPPAARWRPRRAALRQLRHFQRAAIRMAEARSGALTDLQGAHGLEQQLLHALIECLSDEADEETATERRHRDLLARFEDLLAAEPFLPLADICAALGVSQRSLGECCKRHLGMGPSSYRRLRAMQQVYRALRNGTANGASVSEIARQHGFRQLGRLANDYRALYGELPSATLRRGLGQDTLRLRRDRE